LSPQILTIDEYLSDVNFNHLDSVSLGNLFEKFGSDKSNPNDYYKIYAYLLSKINSPKNILEIGLGSNNLKVVSNMGIFGSPGASLRSFREYLPEANIYGADIDKSALFNEDRILTYWVDQTKPESLQLMFSEFNKKFDLIIDDGLHSPDANISTLIAALNWCEEGGFIVIEDIARSARSIWFIVQSLLKSNGINSRLIAGANADLFVVDSPKKSNSITNLGV
jgi:hypothetical protein